MVLGIMIISFILMITFLAVAIFTEEDINIVITFICLLVGVITTIFGEFNGYINYPATEGVHQGVITAVDLEGVYFRRYEVYLKSSGYTAQSDETAYKIYEHEKELAEELKKCIGKEVKLTYGHDGGYIGWKSCGTYHIKSVEVLEEK